MISKNYLKPAVRRLFRDKSYLLVNVLSLAAGLLCCLFIFKYVQHEWSYDRFHENADRLFRIEMETFADDGTSSRYAIFGTDKKDWISRIPAIEQQTRFAQYGWDMNVEVKGGQFTEDGIIAADSLFFRLFSFRLLKGNPETALSGPNSVVISESAARKYFDTTNVLGEVLLIGVRERKAEVTITGVSRQVPSNSHFSFDIVTSEDASEKLNGIHLQDYSSAYSYVKISQHVPAAELEQKLNDLYQKNSPDEASMGQFHLRPITDIHLYSSGLRELYANGNAIYVYLFTVIAFVILAIACVNFTTLATARSVKRSRETAMRKVFGAEKGSLITFFLLETMVLSFAGLILACLFAWFLLPYFNQLAGKSIPFSGLISPSFFLLMTGITVLTGLAAGWYPALVLSQHKPARLLQKNIAKGARGDLIWKSMAVTQFAIMMTLVGGTYIVQNQIRYMSDKDPGFDREHIVTFPNNFGADRQTFMDRLNRHPDIEQVTVSSYIPGSSRTAEMSTVEAEGKSGSLKFEAVVIDPDFFEIYGISITRGRNFSEQFASDSTQAFIINETAVEALGWEQPLGKKMHAYGRDGYVIGVVLDFNLVSFHSKIAPMVFLTYDQHHVWISAKIRFGRPLSETLSDIKTIWGDLRPNLPFRYVFVDDQVKALYAAEQKARSLLLSFSVLAMIIAILGLFSFASYTIQQKTREIGIRKVLGATIYEILKLFYSNYAKLLATAIILALPVGYVWMSRWLQNFSYRTEIGIDSLGIPFVFALVILLLSVSYQVVKGALQNPADIIRTE